MNQLCVGQSKSMTFYYAEGKKKSLISSGALQRGVFFFNLRAKINYIVIPSMTSVGLFVIDK